MEIYEKAKPLCGTSLNYEIVGGTTAPTTFNKENTIWINTDIAIDEHQFGYMEQVVNETVTKSFDGTGGSAHYWTSASGTSSPNDWSTAFITVEPNKQYTITKNQATTNISISYWTSSNGFISYQESKVSSITFTTPSNCSKLKIWTGVANQIAFNALDWKLIYTDNIPCRSDGTALQEGDIWIQTNADKISTSFNAIKKNELIIYPYKIKQWNGNNWESKPGVLYKNGESIFNYEISRILLDSTGNHAGFIFSNATQSAGGSCTFSKNASGLYEIYVSTTYGYTIGDLKVVVNDNRLSKLRILGTVNSSGPLNGGGNGIEIRMNEGSVLDTNIINYSTLIGTATTSSNIDITADISSYDVFTFGVRASSSWDNGYCRFTINKIWLE